MSAVNDKPDQASGAKHKSESDSASQREPASPDSNPTGSVPKVDPETLAIRGRPPRAIRFRREVIIAASMAAAIVLGGVAWIALKPQIYSRTLAEEDLARPQLAAPVDMFDALPKNYGDVPKLGPALPGDLGRPILRAQERGRETQAMPATKAAANAGRKIADQYADERSAAWRSPLLAAKGVAARQGSVPASQTREGQVESVPISNDGNGGPPAADRKVRFAENLDARSTANPHAVEAAASPYTLAAGSIIAASLITALNSDLPGAIIAQVTQNVFDSATGLHLLIPQGARLIGTYDSAVAYGQDRVLVVWQRLLLPDGGSLRLDNMPATDSAGRGGLSGKVDYHTGRLVKGMALGTLLGASTEMSISGDGELVRAIREATQTGSARAADEITRRNLEISPTITIRAGAPVHLLVRQDLIIEVPHEEMAR
ncbi:Conjugal transfer protein TrbI [Novosphingobium resinovorum]|uniref:Conjugal transfer protein TrbI n=1 Tax=Novosphingobium resinovorum TaxID=158500 RepID=A0A031JTU4_9SPHN|nr:TrbI/VirB10 family protein [Novosphingobium resinovorum]EZP80228.1 Conjugal transfer protein TrbI [Novosphingobium resinovorum]